MNRYLDDFLRLRCSADVLGVVNPLGPRSAKEITEAMGMLNAVRGVALARPMACTVFDLCAGNGLVGALLAHVLPVKKVVCVDKKPRCREWDRIRRFEYREGDIRCPGNGWMTRDEQADVNAVIVACHPCTGLAREVVRVYRQTAASSMALIPCCVGEGFRRHVYHTSLVDSKLTRYEAWCEYLASLVQGDCRRDSRIISPCNVVVTSGG